MERALMEQQARVDQAKAALQALQQQELLSATTAQHAQRRAAAAQAAAIGASGVVDTRLLGKPVAFDGRETSWRSFKFQLKAYRGAIDSRLKDLFVVGETRDVTATRNIHMDPDTRALSARRWRRSCWSTRVTLRVVSHGGDCWPRTSQEPQDVLCCRSSFTTSPETREQSWVISSRCFAGLSGEDV